MLLTRRGFTRGALGFALCGQSAARAFGQSAAGLDSALSAIRGFGEQNVSYFGLPGMTLGLMAPGGFGEVLNFGNANREARTPIAPNTLFQVGSITKVMIAAVLHQFVAEGRLSLTSRISDLVPAIPLPSGNAIQVQHLLDHVAGLATDPPLFPEGGLWTAYATGDHWHYSNTGYDILGKLAEHVGGKPVDRLLAERLFGPLGMTQSRGAILGEDRLLYAQGYEAADQISPIPRGVPLAPAAWVDVTAASSCVASTADDINRFLRSLAGAAQGRGGLGLSPEAARALTAHSVPSDTAGMAYGNGLMHVAGGARSYLHHTGGMIGFSSSFHLDVASGVAAFASATITAFADYRPRLLTQFAVDALTNALGGRAPPGIPPLEVPLANAAAYIGRYSGPSGAFEIQAGAPLTIVADGRSAALQPWTGEIFRTAHPDFRRFSLMFERHAASVTGASWGPNSYVRDGAGGGALPRSDPDLARFAGRYLNESPWFGEAEVVERGGRLWLGTETPMERIGANLWRVGAESWSPERGAFANLIDGRPQTFISSGEKFARHDI